MVETSEVEKTKGAKPERTLAARLPLWPLERPDVRRGKTAFISSEILGLLPLMQQTIPTCSAESVKGMNLPFMLIGEMIFA